MIDSLKGAKKRLEKLVYGSDEEILYGLIYELEWLVDILIENEKSKMDDFK